MDFCGHRVAVQHPVVDAQSLLLPDAMQFCQFPSLSVCRWSAATTRSCVLQVAFDPYKAVRVGEALHPGPLVATSQRSLHDFWAVDPAEAAKMSDDSSEGKEEVGSSGRDELLVSVINPTAILGKRDEILSLKADLILAAETSAVPSTQATFAALMRPAGYRCHWSEPVVPHLTLPGQPESRRGCAGGTVVLASCPSHQPFEPMPDDLAGSTRVSEANVRFGGLTVKVFSVYGYPASHADASFKNQALFLALFEHLASTRLPVLIGGDFNCAVMDLPCWSLFASAGYLELHDFYRNRFGDALPMTCKGATAFDSLIVPRPLQGLLISATVDCDGHLFDAHAPLLVRFRAPFLRPASRCWRLPVTWAPLKPPPDLVDKHFCLLTPTTPLQGAPALSLSAAFESWGRRWEQAVHLALREAHHADPVAAPVRGLGRQHRGRCRPRTCKFVPYPSPSRPGRHGDYNPPVEAGTVLARQKVRQVRRLETYARNLAAHIARGCPSQGGITLCQQWRAICTAPGYSPSFPC